MHEITVLSGKGGTGKTTITAALAFITKNAVFCDSDVDAADLHLILKPTIKETHTFHGAWIASIDEDTCTACGTCTDYCRFNAIHLNMEGYYEINPMQCEGCRLCERVCPLGAIHSERSENNYWYISDTRFGPLIHATMGPGEENSGKLVTRVRKVAKDIAKEAHADFILTDGPPGIGCATISSLSGTRLVVMVVEPTKSGLHDARRLVELIGTFTIPAVAIINKHDINPVASKHIKDFLAMEKIPVVAEIPFDEEVVKSMVHEKSINEYNPGSAISKNLEKAWTTIQEKLTP